MGGERRLGVSRNQPPSPPTTTTATTATINTRQMVDRLPENFVSVDAYRPVADRLSEPHKMCLMRTLVHAADICSPAKRWTVANRWAAEVQVG